MGKPNKLANNKW